LTAALKDEDATVRRRAILAIAEIGDGNDEHAWRVHPHPHPNPRPNPKPVIAGIR
jgi:HEAT repeat protein